MILRKYGKSYHSVTPNFDSRAMTEIGFQKSGEHAAETGEFEAAYERVEGHELSANHLGARDLAAIFPGYPVDPARFRGILA